MGVFDRGGSAQWPPVLWRWVKISVAASLSLLLIWMGVVWLLPSGTWAYRVLGPSFCGITVPALLTIGQLPVLWQMHKARTRLAKESGRLCTHCMYSLKSLDDVGRCPECGEPYNIEFDRLMWERAGVLKKQQSDPETL